MTVTLKTVKLTDGSHKILLVTPYTPDLPPRLKALGGKWDAAQKAWYLPADIEPEIRQMCVELFAIDPLAAQPADLVDVRVDVSVLETHGETAYLFGRPVLRRPGRDHAVTPGEGVSILGDGFANHGGSRNNPRIGDPQDGTMLLVRGVPRLAALELAADHPGLVTLLDRPAMTPATPVPAPDPDDLDADPFRRAMFLAVDLHNLVGTLPADEQVSMIQVLRSMADDATARLAKAAAVRP